MLGAHTHSHRPTTSPAAGPESPEDRIQRHLRNVFWLCFIIDKDIALRTGQPVALSDDNCDLTLPPGYVEQQYVAVPHPQDSKNLPDYLLFPVDLRLGIIKSRAYSSLYSFKAHQKTDAELLKEIRELDDELERWRMSVPVEWRPTLSFSHERPDPTVSMHSVMLRLNYHLCMTIIHQASSRCKAWAMGRGQGAMTEGVRSSLALSVEASRSTLMYLETAEHVLMDGVFWYVLAPPTPLSSLLTYQAPNLLPHVRPPRNFLQHPANPLRSSSHKRPRTTPRCNGYDGEGVSATAFFGE